MARHAKNAAKTGQGGGTGGEGRKSQKTPPRSLRPAPITWQTARCEATGEGWRFVLPTPERTNAIWRQWKGRTLVSAKHRADKREAPTRFGLAEPLAGDVAVQMLWVRHRKAGDIDSRIKAALDLLTAMGVWHDDAQVAWLEVERTDDPTRAPGLYVDVWENTNVREAA